MLVWLLNGMGGQNETPRAKPRQTDPTTTDANPHQSDWQSNNCNELWFRLACCEREDLHETYSGVFRLCIAIENSTMTPSSATTPAD